VFLLLMFNSKVTFLLGFLFRTFFLLLLGFRFRVLGYRVANNKIELTNSSKLLTASLYDVMYPT